MNSEKGHVPRGALVVAASAALLIAAAGFVVSASAKDESGYGKFRTPSGNIVCEYSVGNGLSRDAVDCGIKSGLVGVHSTITNCAGGDPVTDMVEVNGSGRGFRVTCAGDPGPFLPPSGPALEYGRTLRRGEFSCSSARTGLTCRNRQGHGFFLSRQLWRVF